MTREHITIDGNEAAASVAYRVNEICGEIGPEAKSIALPARTIRASRLYCSWILHIPRSRSPNC